MTKQFKQNCDLRPTNNLNLVIYFQI